MTDTDDLAQRLGAALGAGYAVERLLGAGGFASVFLVRDLGLKRALAVKVLSPDMIASRTVLERFRREAETVAQLSHPNIVPLHFIGQQDDLLYLAMACIDGGSIADRVDREKTLPVDDVVRITREVASALAHAHRRGVVHRDIKPANVLVDAESGRCLVTDFGIARTAEGTSLTATGMMVGTPAYMSPEQVTGEPSDHRVDIFALGVMAYELLAGRVPFDGPTPTAAMMRRLAGPPDSLASLRPEVPDDVAAVINKCLAADLAERYQTADDVASAFGAVHVTGSQSVSDHTTHVLSSGSHAAKGVTPSQGAATAPRRGWRASRVLWGSTGVALAGAIAVFLYVRSGKEPMPAAAAAHADSSMVLIPSGEYVIGSDVGPERSRPKHTVRLASFTVERTEVTVGAYRAYVQATQARVPWGGTAPDSMLPVTRVTWSDAANYCAWRYKPDGRLPTEFEWEAATRGRAARAFPWGADAGAASANTKSALRTGPVPVASFPRGATPEGVQDLSGNVWEWTASVLAAYPGAKALDDSMAQFRVIRGGSYETPDTLATGYVRGYLRQDAPPHELQSTGFRCARPGLVAGAPPS